MRESGSRPLSNAAARDAQSPLIAFERFVDLVRNSSPAFDERPETMLALLRPFLANPDRNAAHVQEIAEAYAAAKYLGVLMRIPGMKLALRLTYGRKTMQDFAPKFIERLVSLEAALKDELTPGSVEIHVKSPRYIDTPSGFGTNKRHRYRIQIQTAIQGSDDDILESVAVKAKVHLKGPPVEIEDIAPKPAFSAITRTHTAGAEVGVKRSVSAKHAFGAEAKLAIGKLSSSAELATSDEESVSLSRGVQETLAGAEQYMVARKFSDQATWRLFAGIGPIDLEGGEYSMDILVPADVRALDLHVNVAVEWYRVGVVPAEIARTLALPAPDAASGAPRAG